MIKPVQFSQHALDRMADRGATRQEVEVAIENGERSPAMQGRLNFRKNFQFEHEWKNHYYETKQVVVVVKEEADMLIVITVFTFYFGGER